MQLIVVVMVSFVAVVAVLALPLTCVCSCAMRSGPTIAHGAPFIFPVIDGTAIDWSSIDMVEWLISDARRTELARQQFSLFAFWL